MRTRNVSRETPAKATGFLTDRALPMRLNAALTMRKSGRIGATKRCQAQKFWRESGGSSLTTRAGDQSMARRPLCWPNQTQKAIGIITVPAQP